GRYEIDFDILPAERYTIRPMTGLPFVTVPIIIDGTTQPGYSNSPVIELDGSDETGNSPNGLCLFGGNSTVRGLIISGFRQDFGITLRGGHNVIQGNYIGTDATGTQANGNYGGVGVFSSGNLIGTDADGVDDVAERNLISSNLVDGVLIFSSIA